MNCPFCQHLVSRVVDSRVAGDAIRRRRACDGCGRRFTTHERIERRMPVVVKKSGAREAFERDKVYAGLSLACRKRPVPERALEVAADSVEHQVLALGEREVPARQVGALVLEELLSLDRVAYLRFASVYQEFASPEEFLEILQPLLEPDR